MHFGKLKTQILSVSTRVAAVLLCFQAWVFGQGSFANMDFEHPILPLSRGPVPASSAFPNWTAYSAVAVFFDDVSLGGAAISLHDNNKYFPIPQGQYAVLLQASFPGGTVVPALGQVGTVPVTARSVRFSGDGIFTLTFGGQPVPLFTLGSASGYNTFGGDIAAFGGQSGELLFRGRGSLDDIIFSAEVIPEPSVIGLFTFSASFLGWRFRRKRT